ncbi:F-BOX/KELCH-REPEAT PLANT-LIKE PROTEIN [Salix viminalis]|uniref:F-BOX/KELCH-REPEAT PLANT-LIKE PROTEIN n=1 Tax=Salix viminalis TaxID=40686 RepID=A0A9Q0QA89_SALVM|nr:F-BOX/KELCH-REPEAT PLANT-LIKE PROTEIN [Salix viminalis]
MSQERDECEGVVIGDEFWVVSGYGTDNQGEFEGNAEGKDGKLMSWADLDPMVRVGARGITLGSRALLTGSDNQGSPVEFYLIEMKEGQSGKLEKITVPDEFSGFVQSGCCVEI